MPHQLSAKSLLALLVLALALPAGAAAQYDGPPGGDDNVPPGCVGVAATIRATSSFTFAPASLTVEAGTRVCWTWSGNMPHNVRADDGSFNSGDPTNSGTFQLTFTQPGTYDYHCQVHGSPGAGMRGTVVVTGEPTDPGDGGGSGPGKLGFAVAAMTLSEGAGPAQIVVERRDGSDGAVSVQYATVPGAARPGKDFNPRTGVLRWAAGNAAPQTIAIVIKNDKLREPAETFTVRLSRVAGGATLGTTVAAITVQDDDSPACKVGLVAPAEPRAQGQSARQVELTWGEESASAFAVHVERRQAGGAWLEVGAIAAGIGSFVDTDLDGGAVYQYRLRSAGDEGFSGWSPIVAAATDGGSGGCGGDGLCLLDGRFEARVESHHHQHHATGAVRAARQAALLGDRREAGYFTGGGGEPDLLLSVIDGCADNDHFWVSLAGVTDEELTVTVRDTFTGRTWAYYNGAGSQPALRDLDALASCP
jgi:plastocyanin